MRTLLLVAISGLSLFLAACGPYQQGWHHGGGYHGNWHGGQQYYGPSGQQGAPGSAQPPAPSVGGGS